MGNKRTFAGGKFTRRHTSAIPASVGLLKMLHDRSEVKKISLGIIKAGKPSGGKMHVKLKLRCGGFLMTVRGNNSIQEMGVYTDDAKKTLEAISNETLKQGMDVHID